MWVKNIQTGLVWEVTGKLADRLSLDPNYQIIEEKQQIKKEEQQSSKDNKKTNNKIPDYMQLSWGELKKYATSLGIDVHKKTKQEIYQAIELVKGENNA